MDRPILILILLISSLCFVSTLSSNSTIIKTLQFKEGDIVDCYDINKQPTLHHPLLKNHTVQMAPNFPNGPTGFFPGNLSGIAKREVCPPGTVPIPRPTQPDRSVSDSMFTTEIANVGRHFPGHHRSFVHMKRPTYPQFKGAGAWVNVYQVNVTQDQTSGAFVMLHNGSPGDMNLLATGWMSSKLVFGTDTVSRLYIYWTADGYKTSCYNSACQGFVQVDRRIYPSIPLNPTSTPRHPSIFYLSLSKDSKTGNWWLVGTFKGEVTVHVGYWPKEVLPYLEDGASMAAWGGQAIAGGDGKSPPMGSGHFPRGDYNDDSVFLNVMYVDQNFEEQSPGEVEVYGGEPGCYGLKNDGFRSKKYGYAFIYGGPGGKCGL